MVGYAGAMNRVAPILCLALLGATAAQAQSTRTAKSTREAYGVRLDAQAVPSDVNTARLDNRIKSRIENRLSLRIERYRIGQTADPTAAFRDQKDDGSRTVPVIAPPQQPDEQ